MNKKSWLIIGVVVLVAFGIYVYTNENVGQSPEEFCDSEGGCEGVDGPIGDYIEGKDPIDFPNCNSQTFSLGTERKAACLSQCEEIEDEDERETCLSIVGSASEFLTCEPNPACSQGHGNPSVDELWPLGAKCTPIDHTWPFSNELAIDCSICGSKIVGQKLLDSLQLDCSCKDSSGGSGGEGDGEGKIVLQK